MATEPSSRLPLILPELAAATAAGLRVVINDFIHLILRP
jgi:hypothetical protein